MDEEAVGRVWGAILEFRRYLATPEALAAKRVAFALVPGGEWKFLPEPRCEEHDSKIEDAFSARADPGMLRLQVPLGGDVAGEAEGEALFSFRRFLAGEEPLQGTEGSPDPLGLQAFRVYLPILLGGLEARRCGRPFVSAHLAQSLDGRIACANGHSKWISNEANLHHSHRLRALHDAVLVGARTVEFDDPQLTVRHVEGNDPIRVVLSASGNAAHGTSRQVFEGAGATVVCCMQVFDAHQGGPSSEAVGATLLGIDADPSGCIPTEAVSAALVARGIHSIFIEGGAQTLSSFLAAGGVDVLHIHLASLILGSGIPGIQLPELSTVQEGQRVHVEYFELDGELLVECRPRAQARELRPPNTNGSPDASR